MRILQLHSDFIEYRLVGREIAVAEEGGDERRGFEELVVLFACVERGDE